MRQGQNNPKRSRGRGGRNNGRPQNSANRAYDSNGPDVKIRGTATHVCEKYQQLARDAISAGDRVMAENYFQHAEHYYRLLMAAQAGQEGQARPQSNLAYRPPEDEEEETDFTTDTQPQPRHPGQPWHQQNGNGQGGGQNAGPNGGQGGQVNGGQHRQDEGGDDGEDDDRQPDRQAAHQQGGEGEGQPRRRQGRRRRPRGEGQMSQGGGEPRRADGGHEGGEAGGDDVPRAEAPSAPTPEVAPGD
ncbi:MAG: DUF4167 domain-containing protein [Parvibaculum sp.]|nr:DUF4167 domain-containing protein [Parvibaculum sp.]